MGEKAISAVIRGGAKLLSNFNSHANLFSLWANGSSPSYTFFLCNLTIKAAYISQITKEILKIHCTFCSFVGLPLLVLQRNSSYQGNWVSQRTLPFFLLLCEDDDCWILQWDYWLSKFIFMESCIWLLNVLSISISSFQLINSTFMALTSFSEMCLKCPWKLYKNITCTPIRPKMSSHLTFDSKMSFLQQNIFRSKMTFLAHLYSWN